MPISSCRLHPRRRPVLGVLAHVITKSWPIKIVLMGLGITLFTMAIRSGVAWAGGGDPGGGETLRSDADAAVNFAWTLSAAFMVFFMQAGFALVEAGSIRSRSVANVMAKNMMDFMTAGIAFWAFGFAIMFGGSNLGPGLESGNKLIGLSGFFLADAAYDVTTLLYWMFHVMFAATAATIVSGAMAERTKLNAYMAYTFFVSAIVYPVYGHWVWGGGWLGDLSFIREGLFAADFAGSGVVHGVGGMVALVGALVLGPRTGKFGPDGKPRRIPGHSVAFVVLGTLILLFGWFGFNSGSTTAATELRISVIAANTFLAACGGGLIAYFIRLVETEGRADVHATACGLLGGLVAVTAPAAWVAPWAAVVIGAIGGTIVVYGARFLERVLKLDDPVWAVAVHGLSGIWGLVSVGIFADGTYGNHTTEGPLVTGLIYGDPLQLLAQFVAVGALLAWTLITSTIIFIALKHTIGLRISEQDEIVGVDEVEHTQPAYPEFEVRRP